MSLIQKYLEFFARNKKTYIQFNKQLFLGELVGFAAGFIAAEVTAIWTANNEFAVSIFSSAADYSAAISIFLLIFYYDHKPSFADLERNARIRKILWLALRLWPAVAAADVAFLIARPYIHYELLQMQIEPGIGATVAHFLAFGLFNLVAILSRSILDFRYSSNDRFK